jgi:hypothetical protein
MFYLIYSLMACITTTLLDQYRQQEICMLGFRWIVVLSLLSCLSVPTASAEADPVVYGAKTKVARLLEHKLGRDQTRSWQQFKRACCYFGAYTINTEADHGGFAQGFNSLKTAIDAAEVICREVSKAEGGNPKACKLYAYSFPAEISATDRLASGLGIPARNGFLKTYQKEQTKTGYGAFAIGPARGWGASWNWPSKADAKAAAIAQCQADIAITVADIGPPAPEWVKAKGLDQCRIVHETTPAP